MNKLIILIFIAFSILGCLENKVGFSTSSAEKVHAPGDKDDNPDIDNGDGNDDKVPKQKSLCGVDSFKEIDVFIADKSVTGMPTTTDASFHTLAASPDSVLVAAGFILRDQPEDIHRVNYGTFLRRIANDGKLTTIDPSNAQYDYRNGGTLEPGLAYLENKTYIFVTTPDNRVTKSFDLVVAISSDDGKTFKQSFNYSAIGKYKYISEVNMAVDGKYIALMAKTSSRYTYDPSEIYLFESYDYGKTFSAPLLIAETAYPKYTYLQKILIEEDLIRAVYIIQETVGGMLAIKTVEVTVQNGITSSQFVSNALYPSSSVANRFNYAEKLNTNFEITDFHSSIYDWSGTQTLIAEKDGVRSLINQNLNENLSGRSHSSYSQVYSRGDEVYLIGMFVKNNINHARLSCRKF